MIDNDGHILTNAHVVDGASTVTVQVGDEDGDTYDAKVVGDDPSTDVAVLQVDAGADQLTPLELGSSEGVQVGDPVVAIGNPFGLDRTVTAGIVSAVQREISSPNGFTIENVIQTDAPINPGNSGGPLIDAAGEVIGINSQIETGGGRGNVGIGFAVPIDTAREVAQQLIDNGEVQHAFLGISGADLTPEIADVLNLDTDSGALVQSVVPGSPADKAGIEAGDATRLGRRPAARGRRRRDHRGRRQAGDRHGRRDRGGRLEAARRPGRAHRRARRRRAHGHRRARATGPRQRQRLSATTARALDPARSRPVDRCVPSG